MGLIAISGPRIQWQRAEPGLDGKAEDTHCSICYEEGDVSSILAHGALLLNDPNSALCHRVHRTCLLKFQQDICPQCRASYHRDEVPGITWKERFVHKVKNLQKSRQNLLKDPLVMFFIFWAILFTLGWQLRNYLAPR